MDHTDVGLRAAIRALSEVVAPVVGAEHGQASEQLHLAIRYPSFVADRLDMLPQRDRFELSHQLAMAEALRSALQGETATPLEGSIAAGRNTLKFAGATTANVRAATAALSVAVGQAVRDAAALPPPTRREVERTVLRASKDRIAFERAWYLPLGLDPDPHEVLPLSHYLPSTSETDR